MSLFALYPDSGRRPRDPKLSMPLPATCAAARGYRPIIEARLPHVELSRSQRQLETAAPPSSPSAWRRYDGSIVPRQQEPSLKMKGFFAPRTLDEACGALAEAPDSVVLAGGTDIGLWVTQASARSAEHRVSRRRRRSSGIDAAGRRRLANRRRRQRRRGVGGARAACILRLAEQARRFASPPIRNSANPVRQHREWLADR